MGRKPNFSNGEAPFGFSSRIFPNRFCFFRTGRFTFPIFRLTGLDLPLLLWNFGSGWITSLTSEEQPHALRPLNSSFSQIVDRWSWSSITIVNSRSLPQIVIFNDHGSFKPINDHDRKLKKRRSRIVVVANDRRSSDRFRHRRPQIVLWWHCRLRKK